MKPKVFVTRLISGEALTLIEKAAEMRVWEGELPPGRDVLLSLVREIDGLLSLLTEKVDAGLMDAAPRLKVISSMAVGYDNIDVAEATQRGILVGNTPGVLTETTADLAFALLLSAARRTVEGDRWTREGKWKTWGPMVLLGYDVHHATLGIVGLGRIGAEMAKRARGFDMRVIYHSRTRRPEEELRLGLEWRPDLHSLLADSDFVSLHAPYGARTHHMIGQSEFARMKASAIFVNTSRGSLVDQKALYEALRQGRIAGAGLDVTEVEPLPLDDPLLTLDNVVITPHIGSASHATRTRMAIMAAENLIAGLQGKRPPNCVNPEALKE
ncbi:MAG: D-glycerate dehydrogenase [Dehalococcoidia bacterium]|nr:D-glycerate dehydrogenase [Dehalococcoidia bacterium]